MSTDDSMYGAAGSSTKLRDAASGSSSTPDNQELPTSELSQHPTPRAEVPRASSLPPQENDDRRQLVDAVCHSGVCRICLEDLSAPPGDAVTLACACHDAFLHRLCAQRWFALRGDATCEVCNVDTGLVLDPRERRRLARSRVEGADSDAASQLRRWHRSARRRRRRDAGLPPESSSSSEAGTETENESQPSGYGGDVETRQPTPSSPFPCLLSFTARCWTFCSRPVLVLPSGRPAGADLEMGSGEHGPSGKGATPLDVIPIFIGGFLAQYFVLVDPRVGAAEGLSLALAYMSSGAVLLGTVQMLVGLAIARLGRVAQIIALWLWASFIALVAWLAARGLAAAEDDGGRGDSRASARRNEAALAASVVTSVTAAVSPQIFACALLCTARE